MLELMEIKKNEKGQVQESFKTNNPRIKNVTFTYTGEEKDIDKFLQSLIFNYAKQKKVID